MTQQGLSRIMRTMETILIAAEYPQDKASRIRNLFAGVEAGECRAVKVEDLILGGYSETEGACRQALNHALNRCGNRVAGKTFRVRRKGDKIYVDRLT